MPKHVNCSAETDPRLGCPPADRSGGLLLRFGMVVLDKPSGPTSRQAADRVRELVGARKAGHGGTLDPKVTGVLPVLLERSTKAESVLLGCDKTYEGTMRLHGEADGDELERAVAQFRGVITQVPPRRSRVRREPRKREVYRFEVTGRDGRDVRFAVACEGGTYIRKLIHDLGGEVGCGAHMSGLRRTEAAGFRADECVTTAQVREAAEAARGGAEAALRRVIRPVEEALARLVPRVLIDDGAVPSVCTGYPLAVPGVCELDDFAEGETVAVLTLKGELVGVGEALMSAERILAQQHGEAVHVDRVAMAVETYKKGGERDD